MRTLSGKISRNKKSKKMIQKHGSGNIRNKDIERVYVCKDTKRAFFDTDSEVI